MLLSTSTYLQNGAGKLSRMSYGNGDWYVDYGYDALSRLTRQSYNGVTAFEWGYNNKGQTAWEKDHANGRETRYGYDTLGRMSEWWNTSGARGSYRYDENNSLLKWRYGAFGLTAEQENTYRRNLLTKSTVGGVTVNYTYDALTRVSEKEGGRAEDDVRLPAGDDELDQPDDDIPESHERVWGEQGHRLRVHPGPVREHRAVSGFRGI